MNVITDNDIIYINSLDSEDAETFLYANGDESEFTKALKKSGKLGGGPKPLNPFGEKYISDRGVVGPKKEPTTTEKEEAKKKGLVWDNVKKIYVKAQELGIVDSILAKLGIAPRTSDVPEVGVDSNMPQGGQPKQGMSTTTKVLIGVGVVAVIGVILYSSKKK